MSDALNRLNEQIIALKDYPVQDWDPPLCGKLPLRISRDGRWFYQDSLIERQRLIELFARLLKVQNGQHYLVTPVEKLAIDVEDAPFLAVSVRAAGHGDEQRLYFTTSVGDTVCADAEHRLWVTTHTTSGEPRPYIEIRHGLVALLSRPVFYELIERADTIEIDGRAHLALRSAGESFLLGPCE